MAVTSSNPNRFSKFFYRWKEKEISNKTNVLFPPRKPYSRKDGQAELTWTAGYMPRWFTHSQTSTHPSTNRARRQPTTLIETNTLPLSCRELYDLEIAGIR